MKPGEKGITTLPPKDIFVWIFQSWSNSSQSANWCEASKRSIHVNTFKLHTQITATNTNIKFLINFMTIPPKQSHDVFYGFWLFSELPLFRYIPLICLRFDQTKISQKHTKSVDSDHFPTKKFAFDKFPNLPQTFEICMPCRRRIWVTWVTITWRATMNRIFGWTHYEFIVLHSRHHQSYFLCVNLVECVCLEGEENM